ncbi:hypothetical protein MESS4_720085 [Mesorhizobium sp. STM 4661]|nr:hypothetical protein MESS4_720085 [Mesorhizobium sp. STM 4661]
MLALSVNLPSPCPRFCSPPFAASDTALQALLRRDHRFEDRLDPVTLSPFLGAAHRINASVYHLISSDRIKSRCRWRRHSRAACRYRLAAHSHG